MYALERYLPDQNTIIAEYAAIIILKDGLIRNLGSNLILYYTARDWQMKTISCISEGDFVLVFHISL